MSVSFELGVIVGVLDGGLLFLGLVLAAIWSDSRRESARAIERRLSAWPGKPS